MKHFFLVGEQAVEIYPNIAELTDHFTGDVICYDTEKNTPEDLLKMYDGWDGFVVITEQEYNTIFNQFYPNLKTQQV
jgi:MinD-like ATPase involved in chromosome partitioning or flagellar assembly